MTQTRAEKIALAEKEVEIAKVMVRASRNDLERWINLLDLRQETLERLNK